MLVLQVLLLDVDARVMKLPYITWCCRQSRWLSTPRLERLVGPVAGLLVRTGEGRRRSCLGVGLRALRIGRGRRRFLEDASNRLEEGRDMEVRRVE